MPLEHQKLCHLKAAEGFAMLGMYEEANDEVERIDPFRKTLPEVLRVRLEIYSGAKKWELMQVIAQNLAQHDPREAQWPISLAYATRRAISIQAAKKLLLEAVKRFPQKGLIHYNFGCYACQMGDLDEAKQHLQRAFQIDPRLRELALDDEDLRPLWASLNSEET